MITQKRKIGDIGEQIAVDYLKNLGYKIIERNYQKPWGEIDIIAQKQDIAFIEVKTRTNIQTAYPEQSVNYSKQQKIIKTAETYLAEKHISPETSWQIDIIAVELNLQTRRARLEHIKNAVWE